MIAIDTNILIHLYFPSDFSEFSEKVFLKDPNWIAPFLWRSEFRNVILGFFRKKIIDFTKAIEAIEKAEEKMRGGESSVSSIMVMDLAKATKCTSYDCEFVALAKVKEVKLVTWDSGILDAFPQNAITPIIFLE
ncbi:type II toxin-antitoxin system VapC family toxin [bacterium]|nr:type II toxin-antitoxin system VapC family toxin [bacterium]